MCIRCHNFFLDCWWQLQALSKFGVTLFSYGTTTTVPQAPPSVAARPSLDTLALPRSGTVSRREIENERAEAPAGPSTGGIALSRISVPAVDPAPKFLLLCIKSCKGVSRLQQPTLVGIYNDRQLFDQLNQKYKKFRSSWTRIAFRVQTISLI
jgi:hypothetical protein